MERDILKLTWLVAMLRLILLHTSQANKYNVSMWSLATCKEYEIRSRGYTYADFFHINDLKNNQLRDNEKLRLKFYVLTSMDAHILLSSIDRPRMHDQVYEIVLGAGSNTFSVIRGLMGRRRIATNQFPYILSVLDPTPIEIIQTKDGQLIVNIPNFQEPFLNITDPSPLEIHYVSFSSFGMIAARWFYDCEFDGFSNEMEKEKREMSALDRLMVDMAGRRKGALLTAPKNVTSVNFSFNIRSAQYDERSSILTTRMHLLLYWNDPELKWNSSEYDEIKAVAHPSFPIWIPSLVVLNGARESFRRFAPFYIVKVDCNGTVTLLARNTRIYSWCFNPRNNWPNDFIQCEMIMGLNERAYIELCYDKSSPLSNTSSISELSEWSFESIAVSDIRKGILARRTSEGILQTMDGDISVDLTISRNSIFYRNVFTIPALVCEILIVLSFILRGYRREALLLLAVMIASLAFMFISKHAPSSYVPNIMVVYEIIMVTAVISYIIHVASLWLELYPPKAKPCSAIIFLINFSPLRLFLIMRFSDSKEYVDIQEHPWYELAKIINRLSLITVATVFTIVDSFLMS